MGKFNIKRMVINLWLVAHLVMIYSWAVPGESQLKKEINGFFERYVLYFGVWQSWDMFAPNPRDIKITMDAEIKYKDGSQKIWEFPRMDKMGFFEKFRKERYRKWAFDNVRVDQHSGLWLPTVRYIARSIDDPNRPLKSIALRRRWRQIVVPEDRGLAQEPPWNESVFFTKTFEAKHD